MRMDKNALTINFKIYTSLNNIRGYLMTEDETCGASSKQGIHDNFTQFSSQNLKSKDHVEYPGVDGGVLLTLI
jgi:hypothetical protein